jgi:hypothetical protein
MFRAADYRVVSWGRMSPRLEDYDVVVWAPESFELPNQEQCEWVLQWLDDSPGRTLIYIGRDFDAEPLYWRKARSQAARDQAPEMIRREAQAQARCDRVRMIAPDNDSCELFDYERDVAPRDVTQLDQVSRWRTGIDAAKLGIRLESRIKPPKISTYGLPNRDYELDPLLRSNGEYIAYRIRAASSQLIVVANGSFLLNLPLVNHEHRKLAAKLVNSCGQPGRVAFLEGSTIRVFDEEPTMRIPTGLEYFTIWPMGTILMHFAIVGIIGCFVMFPIFGRAKEQEPPVVDDFGHHVAAMGESLRKTADRDYAVQRVRFYHEHVRRDSGVSHRTGPG